MSFWSTLASGLTAGLPGLAFNLVGSLLGGAFGESQSKKQEERNFQYAQQLTKYQYDLQKQQFDYTNMYNRPDKVMNRLRSAGLNPNLAIGSPQTASMPSVSAPHMTQTNPGQLLSYQVDMMKQIKEGLLLSEQARSLKLDNDYKENSLLDRIDYQRALTIRMEQFADMSKDDALIKKFELTMKNDLHNINQLLLHGSDGQFSFGGTNVGFTGWDGQPSPDDYLADLEESTLLNSIRDTMRIKSLSANEMAQKVKNLEKQFEILVQDLRFKTAHAAVEEFYQRLADNGMNPRDPLWARVIVEALDKFGFNLGDAVESVKGFFGK